jgi:dTDP-4-dehydrorhamnose reductase
MRVAVTGANGLLGGAAVAQLAGKHTVLATDRGASSLGPGPYQWADVDLAVDGAVEHVLVEFRAEAVLHAAALTDVDGCERDPELAWRVNVGGTEQVARACRALGARLVAVSTDYVFDGSRGDYREVDLPDPRGAYARSKRCGEEAALVIAPDAAVARVAATFSGRAGAKRTFPAQVVENLSRGEPVKAFSDQVVSPNLAENAAEMILELLLEHDFRGVLHTAGATALSRVELAERVAARFGLSGEIVPVRTAEVKLLAPRPLRSSLCVDRARALLRHGPLPIEAALDRFHEQWVARTAAS